MSPEERAWVERCLDIIYLDPQTRPDSVGLPYGPRRPELGPSIVDLQCCNCGATWSGITGEPCTWCIQGLERQQGYQAELLLRPPDVDPDNIEYATRIKAWIARMKVGIEAGLITRQQAANSFHREQKRATRLNETAA